MVKISKLLDYGLLIVVTITKNTTIQHSAACLSEQTGLNLPTVRKLLNLLCIGGVIEYNRDPSCSYVLVKNANDTQVLDVVKAIESDICITECWSTQKTCKVVDTCTVHNYWKIMNNQMLDILSSTSIYDIVNYKDNG